MTEIRVRRRLGGPMSLMSEAAASLLTVQIGRSLIAVGQLSVLLLTSWNHLTPEILGVQRSPICQGVVRLSVFCLDVADDRIVARAVSVVVLLLVISGIVPSATSALHAWVSFSLANAVGLPDGGDQVAQIVTVFIFLINVGDFRLWAWSGARTPRQLPVLVGVRQGAWWALRLQMAFIYFESAVSKYSVPDWQNGSALYYVVRDPSFGATGLLGDLLKWWTYLPIGTASLTWGTVLVEMAIAVLVLGGRRCRRIALALAVCLHAAIFLAIGLFSFAIVMVGAMSIAALPSIGRDRLSLTVRVPSDREPAAR